MSENTTPVASRKTHSHNFIILSTCSNDQHTYTVRARICFLVSEYSLCVYYLNNKFGACYSPVQRKTEKPTRILTRKCCTHCAWKRLPETQNVVFRSFVCAKTRILLFAKRVRILFPTSICENYAPRRCCWK